MVNYFYRNQQYSVVPCSLEDIPSHIERVLSYWETTNTNINTQKFYLEECVKANEAFKVLNDKNESIACLYWKGIDKNKAIAYYCWFKNGLALAIGQDYAYRYFPYEIVYYVPHERTKLHYKCFHTFASALAFHKSKDSVPINIRNPKMMSHYRKYFKENGVKEV